MADEMGQRETVQGEITEIVGIKERCGNAVQWKLPIFYKSDPATLS